MPATAHAIGLTMTEGLYPAPYYFDVHNGGDKYRYYSMSADQPWIETGMKNCGY
jgi:hypothetical protein